jgi:hypothetical protein
MALAPIVLFVYNRLNHTRKTVAALQQNLLSKNSDLYIYADAARDLASADQVDEVREYLKTVTGFKSVNIRLREKNLGVDANVIQGVTEVVEQHGNIIVLEDDLVTSEWFLTYMNDALDFYQNEQQVVSIHGYLPPVDQQLKEVFFLKGADCWGWATWKRGWDTFEPNGSVLLDRLEKAELQSVFDFDGSYPYTQALKDQAEGKTTCWDIRWYAGSFLDNRLTLHPGKSLVNNIGHDNSGTHCEETRDYEVDLARNPVNVETTVVHDEQAYKAFSDFFRTLPQYRVSKKNWLSKSFKQLKAALRYKS